MYKNNLVFPELVRIEEVSPDGDNQPRILHSLDWSKKNELVSRTGPELPQKWEDYLNEQVYAITDDYMAEIRRMVIMGVTERGISRNFDTVVRDFCLKPSQAYIETAFRLVADCVVDNDTCKRKHDDRKYLLPYMMLYRFWQFQTGCGLPWYISDMNRVVEPWGVMGLVKDVNREFYEDMKVHDRKIIDAYFERAPKFTLDGEASEMQITC